MFTRAEGMDWFVNLRAGMLDDDRWVVPFVELWTREKLPWAAAPSAHSYETVPEMTEFEGLMRDYDAPPPRPPPARCGRRKRCALVMKIVAL